MCPAAVEYSQEASFLNETKTMILVLWRKLGDFGTLWACNLGRRNNGTS